MARNTRSILSIVLAAGSLLILSVAVNLWAAEGSKNERGREHTVTLTPGEAEILDDEATHAEIEPIGLAEGTEFGSLTNFCITSKGQLLACDAKRKEIRIIDVNGKTKATWKLEFEPHAIYAGKDGIVYVGGIGIAAKLDSKGKVLKTVDTESIGFEKAKVTGIEATDKDVFVCFGSGWSLRSLSTIVRFDRDLDNPKTLVEDMRGCCQRLDIVAREGKLYVAENARHRVVTLDREGKQLDKWGKRGRSGLEGFGSCCNPMNLFFGAKGELYTAESGLGRIKKYSTDGKLIGLVGYVGVDRFVRAGRLAASCSNITVAANADESKVYVLDFSHNIIRVLKKKDEKK